MSLMEWFRETFRNIMDPDLKLIFQTHSKFFLCLKAYFGKFWNEEGGFFLEWDTKKLPRYC